MVTNLDGVNMIGIEQWYISVTSPWIGKFLETQYIKCQPNPPILKPGTRITEHS